MILFLYFLSLLSFSSLPCIFFSLTFIKSTCGTGTCQTQGAILSHLFRVSSPLPVSVTAGSLQAKDQPEQVAVFSLPPVLAYGIRAGMAKTLFLLP